MHLLESHAKVVVKQVGKPPLLNLEAIVFLQLLLDMFHRAEVIILLVHVNNRGTYVFHSLALFFCAADQLCQELRALLDSLDDKTYI